MNHETKHIDESLLLRFLLGEATPEETTQIEQWLEASHENRKLLDQYEHLWLETGRLQTTPIKVDIDAAWIRLEDRIETYETKESRKTLLFKLRWVIPAISAAAVLLFLLIPRWLAEDQASPVLLVTQTSETIKNSTLPDGSIITLNENSSLQYPQKFSDFTERRIKLKGEVFVKVVPDKTKPFIVETDEVWVEVTGTEFSVNARPGEDIEVFVKEGEVCMNHFNDIKKDTLSIRIKPGETGKWLQKTDRLIKNKIPRPAVIAWVDHTFYFSDTPLMEVFALLEQHFQVKIDADPVLIKNCRLTTTFENQNCEEIMEIVTTTFKLNYTKQGNSYKIDGDECS